MNILLLLKLVHKGTRRGAPQHILGLVQHRIHRYAMGIVQRTVTVMVKWCPLSPRIFQKNNHAGGTDRRCQVRYAGIIAYQETRPVEQRP